MNDGTPASTASGGHVERPPIDELYARKSSGLVRELGIRDAFSINIGGISPGSLPVFLFIFLALFPQADITVPLLAGAAVGVILAVVYGQLISTMPRSGGDYVYASRIFHPVLGAALGGAVFMALLNGIGPVVSLIAQQVLPFTLLSVGDAFGTSTISDLSNHLTGKGAQLLVSVGVMLIVFLIATRRPGVVTKAIFWSFVLAALALVSFILVFLLSDNADFRSQLGTSTDSYSAVIAAARDGGLQTGVASSAVIAMIPFGTLVFLGYTYAVFPGAEIRRPSKTFLGSALLAIGASLLLLIGFWLAIKRTVGLDFLQSAAWLSVNDPDSYAEASQVQAFAPAYGLVVSGDPVTKLLMGAGILAGLFGNILAYVLVISRLLFGLSFDRLLPAWTTDVSTRHHAPTKATAIAVIGITVFAILGIFTTVLTLTRNIILIFEVIFTIASVAAMVLPYRRRELYEASPKLLPDFGPLPGITVVGAMSAVLNAVLTYLVATKPEISGGYDTGSVITLIAVVVLGVLAYLISRTFLASRGIDLSLAMRQLPPD
jgi:amino acid transporter